MTGRTSTSTSTSTAATPATPSLVRLRFVGDGAGAATSVIGVGASRFRRRGVTSWSDQSGGVVPECIAFAVVGDSSSATEHAR
jgi:hypothetical protein